MSEVKPKNKKTRKERTAVKDELAGLALKKNNTSSLGKANLSVAVYNQEGKETEKINLPAGIFGLKPKMSLIKQALEAQLANARVIHAKTKGRGEVRGGGKKPWRQKGTGRARHGSIRSPLWKGGGVTFGPTTEKIYAKKINKKMKRQALLMVLSGKARDNELVILDKIELPEVKTKQMDKILNNLTAVKSDLRKGVLIFLNEEQKDIMRAARNLPRIKTIAVDSLNIMDLLGKKYLIMTKGNIEEMSKIYKK
ncbi:MAG: 50S ribosomal protein L4 [Parcubacteria group bacterium GW2011_GWC2_42_6]|nr:MAG: 50S ribosomal protein L4 [Parcubacteria group bacterium GW2011_GWA2_42_11]KKS66510.1 MAG: 50S ribosomal protein L4 [Parcubacteria group bacterium GW2011_GWC2_42_6]KKT76500.1 MAG: 50S ribosomal protein L4 [Parcubacteria group bacterium GW2011_GWF2_44_7]